MTISQSLSTPFVLNTMSTNIDANTSFHLSNFSSIYLSNLNWYGFSLSPSTGFSVNNALNGTALIRRHVPWSSEFTFINVLQVTTNLHWGIKEIVWGI